MSEEEAVKAALLHASKSLGGMTESEAGHYAKAVIAALEQQREKKP